MRILKNIHGIAQIELNEETWCVTGWLKPLSKPMISNIKRNAFLRRPFTRSPCVLMKPSEILLLPDSTHYCRPSALFHAKRLPRRCNSKYDTAIASGFTQLSKLASGMAPRLGAVSIVLGTTTLITTFFPFASSFINSASRNISDFAKLYATIPLPFFASSPGFDPTINILPLFCFSI